MSYKKATKTYALPLMRLRAQLNILVIVLINLPALYHNMKLTYNHCETSNYQTYFT